MKTGDLVCSLSGHDKGVYYAILNSDANTALVCDGRHRRLSNPKRKNIKHLKSTGFCVNKEQLATDKSVRKAIFGQFGRYEGEEPCQKKI